MPLKPHSQLIKKAWQLGQWMPLSTRVPFRREHFDQAEPGFNIKLPERFIEHQVTDLLECVVILPITKDE